VIRESLENDGMKQRANDIGRSLCSEGGVANAVKIIENYLEV
jgi:hypothetical protein